MQERKCPICGNNLPTGSTRCTICGHDADMTVRIDRQAMTAPMDAAMQPKRKKHKRTILLLLAILFVFADIALAIYYFYTKSAKEEALRIELAERAEQQRKDSIAAVERAEARRDSLLRAEEARNRIVKFSTLFTTGNASMSVYSDDEVTERQVTVQIVEKDISATLEMQGYNRLSTRTVSYEIEGGEMVSGTETVYGINCRWDTDGQRPYDMTEPWNCIVVTPGECGNTFTIFFDTVSSREEFLSGARAKGMLRNSDGTYTGYTGYRYEGRIYVEDGLCSNTLTITPGMNNSLVIR